MKISVAMTTCNGAAYLREQLHSIFAQTRPADELIVCDDCSTDETPQILAEYERRFPEIVSVTRNRKRLGSTKNFEQAIQLCTGEVIALSDQDDVWRPHKLETIEQQFNGDQTLGVVFSNGDLIDESGECIGETMWSRFSFGIGLQRILQSDRASNLLLSRCFMTGATIAFRSSFRRLALPIPDHIENFIHDRWIAVIIGGVARIKAIDEALIGYRIHPHQQMGVGKEPIIRRYLRPYDCSGDYEALSLMRQRLGRSRPMTANPLFMQALASRQRHIQARRSLSGNFLPRLVGITKEYLSGRYQLYPLGSGYALKDLLVGTR